MEGELFHYEPSKRLVAFESSSGRAKSFEDCLVVIGGMYCGLLSLSFVPELARQCSQIGWSTVQVLLSSSYTAFGIHSLEKDALELASLLECLVNVRGKRRIFLLGHSTGCQDILWYFQNNSCPEHRVVGALLQGAVSDRDYWTAQVPEWQSLLNWAIECCDKGQLESLFPKLVNGVPMSAYRSKSLLQRMGDDDYFSVDLTDPERKIKFEKIPVPTFVLLCGEDEYVPNKENYPILTLSYQKASPNIRVLPILAGADHGISNLEAQKIFCDQVISLLVGT